MMMPWWSEVYRWFAPLIWSKFRFRLKVELTRGGCKSSNYSGAMRFWDERRRRVRTKRVAMLNAIPTVLISESFLKKYSVRLLDLQQSGDKARRPCSTNRFSRIVWHVTNTGLNLISIVNRQKGGGKNCSTENTIVQKNYHIPPLSSSCGKLNLSCSITIVSGTYHYFSVSLSVWFCAF